MEYFEQNKKIVTPLQALKKAEAYCAYQERCQQEVRDKLYTFGLDPETVEGIIAELIVNGYLSDSRFAEAYVRGKFKMKKWGKNKIIQGLKFKRIPEPLIKYALKEIDEEEYALILDELVEKRFREVKESNPFRKKQKLVSYLLSRGFEYELINISLQKMQNGNK